MGELNPYGIDPKFALYPHPRGSSGHRLARRILGLHDHQYLSMFDRTNLCVGEWSSRDASVAAFRIVAEHPGPYVLLGSRVATAFGFGSRKFERVEIAGRPAVLLPHPSGRVRDWNSLDNIDLARNLVRDLGVQIPWALGG